jgi:hypothetical protein
MDEKGYVFDKAPTFSGNIYFEFRTSVSSSPVGTNVLSPDTVEHIISLKNELAKLFAVYGDKTAGKISRVDVRGGGDYEFQIVRTDSKKTAWKLIFSGKQVPEVLLDNAETALTAIANDKRPSKNIADLDYMDLRFGRKVFYKFAGEK